jgi:hypothetical protein
MLLANRQLHAEYAQAFYERTNFFFYVGTNTDNGERPTTVPLRTLPPALLPNLRQCKLYVDLGMLPLKQTLSIEALAARIEALLGRMEQVRWVHLVWNLSIWMERPANWRSMLEEELEEEEEWLREWLRESWRNEEEMLWEWFGERFVQCLKGGAGMRGMIVTVRERTLKLEREGAEWVEREVMPY